MTACGMGIWVSILCQSRLFLLPRPRHQLQPAHRVSILCQSRLFLLQKFGLANYFSRLGIHPLSIEAISPTCRVSRGRVEHPKYPSSVNRGYFSYSKNGVTSAATVAYPSSVNRGYFSYSEEGSRRRGTRISIHPLSIEAISPTSSARQRCGGRAPVSILCQSRLFLLQCDPKKVPRAILGIHPLSIEAISPTGSPDSVGVRLSVSIHPLSIEAISPTDRAGHSHRADGRYPSSVNRGYFSYFGGILL